MDGTGSNAARRFGALALASALLVGPTLPSNAQNGAPSAEGTTKMADVRFMTLDPGHFHASLLQREMYPNVSPVVSVYAPLGPDLIGHLNRVASFNLRTINPTSWRLDVHTGGDFFDRMLKERPGNSVVFSGRNREKIDRVEASIAAGLNVFVDKPWVLNSSDLPKVERALAEADAKGLVAYDIMTERFEITTILQRELVNDRATFGELQTGTATDPGIYMESVHFLMKVVAGAPLVRPVWFFDTNEQGEALTDIGTHLVDLAQWTAFPQQAINYQSDVKVLSANRWPTMISEPDFKRVTGGAGFPANLRPSVRNGLLEYFCNTLVSYTLRGVHTTLNVIWDWESPGGSDTHFAIYKGGLSRIEARQTKADNYRPELYIIPNKAVDKPQVLAALKAKLASLQDKYPGVAAEDLGADIRLSIPDALRVGHEAHFAQVTANFLAYINDRSKLPQWERPGMLAKYYVTTKGTELSREGPARIAPRIAPQ